MSVVYGLETKHTYVNLLVPVMDGNIVSEVKLCRPTVFYLRDHIRPFGHSWSVSVRWGRSSRDGRTPSQIRDENFPHVSPVKILERLLFILNFFKYFPCPFS